MTEAQKYKAAILEQAAYGTIPVALFERISDETCSILASEILSDNNFRAAILHENCAGLADTYLLRVAA